MDEMPIYSVVVPVFRSGKTLVELFSRMEAVFKKIEEKYELILVEDGGGDDSWLKMKSLQSAHPHVKIIRLSRNFGQHNALLCGFSFATGRYVITMDDDLQNPPEEIPKLIQTIASSDVDVVFGVPEKRHHSISKNVGSFLHGLLISRLFKLKSEVKLSNFRIIRKEIVDAVIGFSTPNPAIGLLLLSVTDRVTSISVDHHRRKMGDSHYSFSKMLTLFFHGLLYHSDLPLKAVFVIGTVSLLLSIGLGLYYLVLYLMGSIHVSGWTTIVLLILFFSGIGMFSVGIIGEYLLRIIQEVNRMPQYIIRDKEVSS